MKWIIFISLFVIAGSAAGQVYRYVDDEGNVIYSDTPPESAKQAKPLELPEDISQKARKEAQQELERLLQETNASAGQPTAPEQPAQDQQKPEKTQMSGADKARVEELQTRVTNILGSVGNSKNWRNRLLSTEAELKSIYKKYNLEYQSRMPKVGRRDPALQDESAGSDN